MSPMLQKMMDAERARAASEGRVTDAGTVCVSAARAAYIDHCEKHGPDADLFERLGRPAAH